MSNAYNIYIHNSRHNRDLNSLYTYVQTISPTFDASQLLRSEYALIVSAFDKYVHDIVRDRLLYKFFNESIEPDNLLSFSLYKVKLLLEAPNQMDRELLMAGFIQQATGKSSFQSPKSIEYALSLIGIKKIWNQLAPIMEQSAANIREKLAIFINRRNKIVHESDMEITTNTYADIDLDTVNSCYVFINDLVEAIEKIIR